MRTKSSFTSGISTPAWLRMNATAKSGSIPPEQPAMIEIVPVGATVVRLQLRSFRIGRMRSPFASRAQVSSGPQMLASHAGNAPRCSASRSEACFDSSSTKAISLRASSTPSSLSYGTPTRTSRSAQPMIPSPIRRIVCASSWISGSGYWFASITLSRKCVDRCTAWRRPSQSIRSSAGASAGASVLTNTPTLTEPRLQTSYGSSGCSPHGFVAS